MKPAMKRAILYVLIGIGSYFVVKSFMEPTWDSWKIIGYSLLIVGLIMYTIGRFLKSRKDHQQKETEGKEI